MGGFELRGSQEEGFIDWTKGYLHKILRFSNQYKQDLFGVKSELSSAYLSDASLDEKDVIAVGIGGGIPGQRSGFLAVRIVANSREALDALPKRIHGIPVVGEVVDEFRMQRRCRPVHAGVSIGLASATSLPGTLAGFVTIRDETYALSAAHVLCPPVAGGHQIDVVQPGIADNGSMIDDVIAASTYAHWGHDGIDAHVAKMNSGVSVDCRLKFMLHSRRIYAPTLDPVIDMPVCKIGKRTMHTNGIVSLIGADVKVRRKNGGLDILKNQFLIKGRGRKFTDDGDSGSLVFSRSGRHPVGMVVAGSQTESVCAPITNILQKFDAEFRFK